MPAVPTTAVLFRLNQSVMALGSAVEEIRMSIEQGGDVRASLKILDHLRLVESNGQMIADLISEVVDRLPDSDENAPGD